MEEYSFTVKQSGRVVARGWAPSLEDCQREGMRYALQYAEDGEPIKLEFKKSSKKDE